MYVNQHFSLKSVDQAHELIEDYPFATLISNNGRKTNAAHIPLVLHREEGKKGVLWGHVAARDEIVRDIRNLAETLVIFAGPRAYVSPNWYENPGLPTYNYLVVHVRGRFELVTDRKTIVDHLEELVAVHEERSPTAWSIASASRDYMNALMEHIVAFAIEIESVTGKFRLSQNRSAGDRKKLIAAFKSFGPPESVAMANIMEKFSYPQGELLPLLDLSEEPQIQEDN